MCLVDVAQANLEASDDIRIGAENRSSQRRLISAQVATDRGNPMQANRLEAVFETG